MDAEGAMQGELHRLRRHRPEVSGAVLAGVDGLLVASDLPGFEPDHVAALAAASAGLGQRFTTTLGHGPLREYVVRGTGGCVVTYPAGRQALLSLVTVVDAELTLLHDEARAVARRLGEFVDSLWPQPPLVESPPRADPQAPLAARTPMSTLPGTYRSNNGNNGN
ncbi:roadblock/LC7 domain-containing protein, partial [Micromonospora zhanjiangensis]